MCARNPREAAPVIMFVELGPVDEGPAGFNILRTSEDFASSSQAAWIAASRDSRRATWKSALLGEDDMPHHSVIAPLLLSHRCPSYRDQGKLHPDRGTRTASTSCASTTVWLRCKPEQY